MTETVTLWELQEVWQSDDWTTVARYRTKQEAMESNAGHDTNLKRVRSVRVRYEVKAG